MAAAAPSRLVPRGLRYRTREVRFAMPAPYAGKLADPDFRHDRASRAGRSRTTPEYHVSRIRAIVDKTRAEQGLPPHVTDPLTLAKVADILRLPAEGQPDASDAA